jgi:hypothetical protein
LQLEIVRPPCGESRGGCSADRLGPSGGNLEPISVGTDSPVSGGQAVELLAATVGSAACAWRRFQRDIDLICLHGQAFIAMIAKAKPSTHIKSQALIR